MPSSQYKTSRKRVDIRKKSGEMILKKKKKWNIILLKGYETLRCYLLVRCDSKQNQIHIFFKSQAIKQFSELQFFF